MGDGVCLTIWNWSFQISIWYINILLVFRIMEETASFKLIFVSLVIYLIYIINSCCSTTYEYLKHTILNQSIQEYMKKIFKSNIEIKFFAKNYHTETEINLLKKQKMKEVKKITSQEEEIFHYKSCRDTSGVFELQTKGSSKTFLKLHLEKIIEFNNDGSESD
jgi:hypothetical protein